MADAYGAVKVKKKGLRFKGEKKKKKSKKREREAEALDAEAKQIEMRHGTSWPVADTSVPRDSICLALQFISASQYILVCIAVEI